MIFVNGFYEIGILTAAIAMRESSLIFTYSRISEFVGCFDGFITLKIRSRMVLAFSDDSRLDKEHESNLLFPLRLLPLPLCTAHIEDP